MALGSQVEGLALYSRRRLVRVASEGALRERALLRARLCGQKRALCRIALSTEEDERDVEGARARGGGRGAPRALRARHVIFTHALEGDAETVRRLERQAIARCARPGQEGEVHIYSFAVADAA